MRKNRNKLGYCYCPNCNYRVAQAEIFMMRFRQCPKCDQVKLLDFKREPIGG